MSDDTVFPTSFAQRRLWLMQTIAPESTAYNLVFQVEIPYIPDPSALQAALNDLVARHEPLRTRFAFENGEPVQVVAPHGALPLSIHDSHQDPLTAPEFTRRLTSMTVEPFDLARAPLARAALGIMPGSRSLFALVIHHIIVDATSMRILAEELNALYQARASAQVALLPEAPVQYGDFAAWQRRMLSSRRLETLTDYWRGRLDGLAEIEIAPHQVRPPIGGGRGAVHPFALSPHLVGRLRSLAADSRTTLFVALLSAWSVLIGRLTGEAAVPIGIPVSGRPKPELERVVGPFVNSIVMRADLSARPTFQELLHQTSAALAEDLTHQDLPFELLVERLNWPRRADRNPIFQIMFQLQMRNRLQPPPIGNGASLLAPAAGPTGLAPEAITSQLDLSCIQYETTDDGIAGAIVYAAELFREETIAQLVDGYIHLLNDALQRPAACVDDLQVMSEATRDAVLAKSEGERRCWADERLDDWFARQAELFPDRVAVLADTVDGGGQLTFAELAAAANGYAAAFARIGVTRGRIVGIALPRGLELVAAVLGVLQAGGAYCYLDPQTPPRRRAFILSDCDAAAVVVPPGGADLALGRPCIIAGDVRTQSERVCPPHRHGTDPAYVIYTSGSTGQPKGVVIPHVAIVNHMHWMLETFPLTPDDRVLQRTPLTFDASVWELFAPLLAGAQLVLAPDQQLFDPNHLADVITQHRITTLQVVPSLLRGLLASAPAGSFATLRRVFCGGEPLTADLRDAVFAASSAQLCNLYGPTETTIDATYHVCQRDDRRPFVPIGRPIANAAARVLNEHGAVVPLGAAGELYIVGAPIGSGYINLPELTAERFIADPAGADGRAFRTGDRVRILATGELEFLERRDDQVKVRGYRIELGEIESILARHPGVAEVAAIVQEHGADDLRLVAFVVPETGPASSAITAPQTSELRAWLRERLPAHLVPSSIAIVDNLPRTRHGKVDRAALRIAPVACAAASNGATKPRSDLELAVCRSFEEVLRVPTIGIDDDFFHLGGHSLLALTLRGQLTAATDRHVSIVDIFEHPTPRQLARELRERPLGMHPGTTGA